MDELDFVTRYTLLNAVHYGVPQMRERMFLIGLRKELAQAPAFPRPTHSFSMPRGYQGIRQAASRALGRNNLLATPYWQESPVAKGDLKPAVTARQAIGDLPPIMSLRNGTLRRGRRKFDTACGYSPWKPSTYARDLRNWPGFEGSLEGPRDHVIRYLPRDWPIFERMRPGDEYPAAHTIAEALFYEAVNARRDAGRVYPQRESRMEESPTADRPTISGRRLPQ